MKKAFMSVLLIIAMLCASILPIYASDSGSETILNEDGSSITYYDDGSYLVISSVSVTESSTVARASAQNKIGTREAKFVDSDGNVEWKYTLAASFTYTYGSSVSCIWASYDNNIYDDAWTFSNGSSSRSGNIGYGKGHYTKKVLFITVKNYDIDLSISCDKYGNLS